MNIVHKRKKTTAASLKRSLPKLGYDESWIYGTGKLTNEEYHNSPHSISTSIIKEVANPSISDYEVYRKYIKRDVEREQKDHFDVGSSAHMAVLEPNVYAETVAIRPDEIKVRRGKAWDEFVANNEGKTIITSEQQNAVMEMRDLINGHSVARDLLSGTQAEVSGFRRCNHGVIVRARADAISHKHKYAVDLKFMDDVSPAGFSKAAVNNGYYIQDHVYRDVFDLDDFIFICVSKKDPKEVAIYQLNSEYQEKAAEKVDEALGRYKECLETNRWLSFTDPDESPIVTLTPPTWFAYQ